MTDDFSRLSPPDQNRQLDNARAASDWAAATGPLGGVIRHMRERAHQTRRTALLFLYMLIVTVVLGLTFYLGLPFWQIWADGTQKTLQETLDRIALRKSELDDRRAILLQGENLAGTGKASQLATILESTFDAVGTNIAGALRGSISYNGQLYLFGNGPVRRIAADGSKVEAVPVNTTVELLGAAVFDGRLYFFGGGQGVLRLRADGKGLEAVPSNNFFWNLRGAQSFGNRLYLFGDFGTLVRITLDGAGVELIPTGAKGSLWTAQVFGDKLYLFGENGTLLRLKDDASGVESISTGVGPRLRGVHVFGGQLYLFGEDGTLLRLRADASGVEQIATGIESLLLSAQTFGDRLYIFGENGTLLRLKPDASSIEQLPTGTGALLTGSQVFENQLYIFGQNGILLRVNGEASTVELIPTGTGSWLSISLVYGNQLHLFGSAGTSFRLADDGKSILIQPTGTADTVASAFKHEDRIYFLTVPGSLFTRSHDRVAKARDLPVEADPVSVSQVEAFFTDLPDHIRNWQPIRKLEEELRIAVSERSGLDQIEERTASSLGRLLNNPLQYLRERKVLDFGAFLETCRGSGTASHELTTSCLAAWSSEQAQSHRSWWEALADQLPPGILLLFLLATLGGLYRYNVRLASFHDSRADALQLLSLGRTPQQLQDILAKTPGEAVNLATIFLAADKVEMGTIRAKLGQAEIELAKALGADKSEG